MLMKAKKGFTFDPCHGCGQVPTQYGGRKKDAVCSECSQTLSLAKRAAHDQKQRGDAVVVAIPTQSHWLPYLYEKEGDRGIQKAFWELAIASSAPRMDCSFSGASKRLIPPGRSDSWSPHAPEDYRLMPSGVADSLHALFDAIGKGLDGNYNAGKRDGSNLLNQLASGGITTEKFNEWSLSSQ